MDELGAQWEAKLLRQCELEDNSLAMGGERFRRKLAQAETQGRAGVFGAARRLLQEAIEPLQAAIEARLAVEGVRGVKPLVCKWAPMVGPDVAAYMTVKVVLDGVAKKQTLRSAAMQVSDLIIDELRYRKFKKEAPYLFDYKMSRFNTSSYTHMSRSLDHTIRYAEIDISEYALDNKGRLLLGTQLINLLIEATGLVEVESVPAMLKGKNAKYKTDTFLKPTAETAEWLTARNLALEMLWPVTVPMVVPPLPWSETQRGGYRFAMRAKYPLVRGMTKAHMAALKGKELPVVYEALNQIQDTAWRINSAVLQVVEAITDARGGFAGITPLDPADMPAKPVDIDTNKEARRVWKRAANAVKDANHLQSGRILEFTRCMAVAKSMRDEKTLYFPFNLDFRGRVYPIGTYLHPQGDDLAKGLLTFAAGKRLGQSGVEWLAIHGANKMGDTPEGQKVSKMTLRERIQWVYDNGEHIVRSVESPLEYTWWASADKPLQFFAFCVEWAGVLREGIGYVSHLPVSMDGSCNGLQHFSAMLRDEVGGREVNLTPLDQPRDIYEAVAVNVLGQLETMAADDPVAAQWLSSGLVNRKLCKRPTMTFGYGSKKFGFAKQVEEYLHGLENAGAVKEHFLVGEANGIPPAARLIAGLIWEALKGTVVAAFEGMEYMQNAARLAAGDGKCVSWTVPETGFPVRQEYYDVKRSQVKTVLAGKIVKPSFWTLTDDVNVTKQANAISPNIIHSLDAAALMLTVQDAVGWGITSFSMVHDSYGTHAADALKLAVSTRVAFVRFYRNNDVLAGLHAELRAQVPEAALADFPALPAMGALDLDGIIESEYFFA